MVTSTKNTPEKELLKQIEDLKKQLEETTINWKRALADYQNLEKRTQAEKQEMGRYKTKALAGKFLEILDLLNSAQNHINDDGLSLIIKKFNDLIEAEGLTKIDTNNKKFDPGLMECIETVFGEPEDQVAEEILPGYLLDQIHLVRPAKVKVFKQ